VSERHSRLVLYWYIKSQVWTGTTHPILYSWTIEGQNLVIDIDRKAHVGDVGQQNPFFKFLLRELERRHQSENAGGFLREPYST
jgi:hypothetical protein